MSQIAPAITALLVIALFSILYKENALFSYVEHIYVGIASAHFAVLGVASIKTTAMVPLSKGDYLTLVPIALGLLLYFQLSKKYSWLAKISTSFLIALGAGIGVRSSVQAEFLSQIKATAEISLWNIDNLIIVAGTVSCVLFFYFTYIKSAPMRNLMTLNSKFARIILMVSFGAALGNTMLTRISYVTAAFKFVFGDWLHLTRF